MAAQVDGAARWTATRKQDALLDWHNPQTQEADKRLQAAVGPHLLELAKYANKAASDADTYSLRLLSHYCRLLLNTAVREMALRHGVNLDVD
jgi:hypothetical protein